MSDEILRKLTGAIVRLDPEGVEGACRDAIAAGIPPTKTLESMARGMDIVGQKYEAGEYFLAELMMAGEVMKGGVGVLEPHMKGEKGRFLGRVVIGTVRGDLHDVGKDLAKTLIEIAGFEVLDLGVDVAPETFVQAVQEHRPNVVAMSALLTLSLNEVENTVKALEKAGLRDKVKVLLGGAPVTEQFGKEIGADAVAMDAVQGARICRDWFTA